jgi:hypothetical protein
MERTDNHGTNQHATLLMVDIKKKIEACENVLHFNVAQHIA